MVDAIFVYADDPNNGNNMSHVISDDSIEWDAEVEIYETQAEALKRLGNNGVKPFKSIIRHMIDTNTNRVFSPATMLASLALLSSICNGKCKAEIHTALDCSETAIHSLFVDLFTAVTGETTGSRCEIASSLWFNEAAKINKESIRDICQKYKADAFCGQMGTAQIDAAIQKWVNVHTRNMLKRQVGNMKTDATSMLRTISTSFFKAAWSNTFSYDRTEYDLFYDSKGKAVDCKFMNGTDITRYYCGEKFSSAEKRLCDYSVLFFRPNNGYDLHDVVNDDHFLSSLTEPATWMKEYEVCMSIPKFEVTTKIKLKEILDAMGIISVFEEGEADFSSVMVGERLCLSDGDHASVIKLNEEGVEAAAYIDYLIAAVGLPPKLEKVEFKLDRPFAFAVMKGDTIPMYVGTFVDP